MRFIFFNDQRLGVLDGERVLDLSLLMQECGPLKPQDALEHLIVNQERMIPQAALLSQQVQGLPLKSVRLRASVPRPIQLLCAIRNYKEGSEIPELDFFLKSPLSIIGPEDTVELPDVQVRSFAHEAELAVVIGREARNIPASRAMDYVFGYTGFIDVSARGIGASFYRKKSFVTFGPIGPVLVTADEIADPHDLRVRLWVNGDLRQDYSTADMAHRIDRLIAAAAAVSTLYPGDVIATGTHHKGLGPLHDGDVVTLDISGIGSMVVRVSDPLRRVWPVPEDTLQPK